MFKRIFVIWLVTWLVSLSPRGYAIDEIPVEIIPLAPPLDQAQAELSGLSWCGDKLILLPQYPKRLSDDDNSYFYYLERQQITDYLDRTSREALKAKRILINEKDLRKAVSRFDGFEAIACNGNNIWLSIEAINGSGAYQSFVVPGTVWFDQYPRIELNQKSLVRLSTQSNMRNIGDEAIVMLNNDVIAIHEVNDQSIVSLPKGRKVIRQNQSIMELPFPNIPFRITDASELDQDKRFWVINYKYSGDKFSRKSQDVFAEKYGEGTSHQRYYNVERLLELRLEDDRIKLLESAPIFLKMTTAEGRNWEGLARLEGRGFLLVTDKHPKTLFGFVPHKEQ